MRYYEDLVEGVVEESGTRTVTREELIAFATQYDPQYFHADDIQWICGVAWDDVRFPKAVRPRGTLRARARCLSRRPSHSDPRRGVVVYEYALLNPNDEVVFTCRSTNLVERRA